MAWSALHGWLYRCRGHGSGSLSVTLHGCLCAFLTSWSRYIRWHAYHTYDHILSWATVLHIVWLPLRKEMRNPECPRLIYTALLYGGLEGCRSSRRLIFCVQGALRQPLFNEWSSFLLQSCLCVLSWLLQQQHGWSRELSLPGRELGRSEVWIIAQEPGEKVTLGSYASQTLTSFWTSP